jgi:hypothetical protein
MHDCLHKTSAVYILYMNSLLIDESFSPAPVFWLQGEKCVSVINIFALFLYTMKSLSLVFSLRLLEALGSALGVFLLLLQVDVLVDFVADQACGKKQVAQ